MAEPDSPVLGLHIEGPYLNKKMAGEQFADQVKEIDGQEYRELVESTRCIRRWDASPELPVVFSADCENASSQKRACFPLKETALFSDFS